MNNLKRNINKILFLFVTFFVLYIAAFTVGYYLSVRNARFNYYLSVMDDLEKISLISAEQEKSSEQLLTEFKTSDIRVANLKYYFRKYESVLYDKSEYFVAMADKYQLDYRLLPAIAMQESNLCKHIYAGSYNCWGWGIYGNKVTRFSSYEEAIETISRGLKKNYIDKGFTTPEEIMRKYTPPSDGSWAFGVNTFLKVID